MRHLVLVTFTFSLIAGQAIAQPERKDSFSFASLASRAEQLAKTAYCPSPELPQQLKSLDYDRFRLIAFEHEQAIWKRTDRPFWLEMFHRGYLYGDRVAINLLEEGKTRSLEYDRKLFQYRGAISDLDVPADVGFAGFRVLGKFESSPHFLEIASFLGASYFRAIGRGQVYGTSARGLAIDIGLPKTEEFPVFREFWIEAAEPGTREIKIWALLDSASVTGAYQIVITPGDNMVCDITARLFFRRPVEKMGMAPLTSMWMWGDGWAGPADDPRRKVHDADGLLIETNRGEWIWRPLSRHEHPSLSHYDFAGIRGFGLMQRDRRPEHFNDDEAKYHLRPSVWIEPHHGWQDGAVELLELPADHEGVDNIATWWSPKAIPAANQKLDIAYRLSFGSLQFPKHKLARAIATRVLRNVGQPIRVQIDFSGAPLKSLADGAIEHLVTAQRGETKNVRLEKLSADSWQLSFDVGPAGKEPVELQAALRKAGQSLSETWRYLCRP